jgi:thioredoxin reductase/NAD-dependent dihydropyrimidine dehydrogenase PreA subunit
MDVNQYLPYTVYAIPIVIIWLVYVARRALARRKYLQAKAESEAQGLNQPNSLHPVIDPAHCIGCATCVAACPEKNVLGIIDGKGELVKPANCIGHGACKTACPVGAIKLVFGTEERGIELPEVKPDFETNVPGMYIAGELGGMGLVRNAIEQGKQAMQSIQKSLAGAAKAQYDVVIVGAGPAGIAASLAAQAAKLNYLTLEQDSVGGTVFHFPRNKVVMTAPAQLPLAGKMSFRETSKESLLEFWLEIINKHSLNIQSSERLEDVAQHEGTFQLTTNKGSYTARKLLLCLGRRGTPRKLGVPGEELAKVVYSLADPAQYVGQHVLVAGGGDSALEAALDIADEQGTTVHLAYRGDSFSRAKPKNRERIEAAAASGKLQLLFNTTPAEITAGTVKLNHSDTVSELKNDAMIICAGGILPTGFLKSIGINIETKYGTE